MEDQDLRTNAQTNDTDANQSQPTVDIDALSRQRIVREPNQNFFVEAGAGSGKTTMLVNRMVAMVESNNIEIEKICAITFTKAAAAEFYDRFQKILIKRSRPDQSAESGKAGSLPKPTEETMKLCEEAHKKIDLCFMGTIDSFCQMILSEHPSEAGIPSDSCLISKEEESTIYEQEFVKIINDPDSNLQSLARLFHQIHKKPKEAFLNGMRFFMEHRNAHFNFTDIENPDIDQIFAVEKSEIVRAAKYLSEHPELAYPKPEASANAWNRISNLYRILCRNWTDNLRSVLWALECMRDLRLRPEAAQDANPSEFMSWFIPHENRGAVKWYHLYYKSKDIEEVSPKVQQIKQKLEELRYSVSMSFWNRCVPIMESSMRTRGCLTYFDYLFYLRNLLKEDAKNGGNLIRYISARHRYFLIDEFQDTNPLQAEVFFYLSSDNPKKRWNECIPRPGSLFIVGDPKQSIYRFRSADVSSFERVRKLFELRGSNGEPDVGEVLTLSRNFRSTRTVCEYFNRVMPVHMPGETTVDPDPAVPHVRFEDIPLPQPTSGEFQGIFTFDTFLSKPGKYSGTDPSRIADIIGRLVRPGVYCIREKDGPIRPLTYKDFMVITPTKTPLKPILDELKVRNIPVRVEGVVPFVENAALKEIILIFHAVADADNPIALLGALTGSKFTLTHEALHCYKTGGNEFTIRKPAEPGSVDPIVSHTAEQLSTLADLYKQSSSLSPAALFSFIMDQYRIFESVPAEDMEVVYYAEELIRNAERRGDILSLKDCASYLQDLTKGITEEERCLSLQTEKNCVHLANLHKVKGLEAPVVILSEAPEIQKDPGCRIVHGDDSSEGYVFYLQGDKTENYTLYIKTSGFDAVQTVEKEESLEEKKRLVYVAATRARNALILCDSKFQIDNDTVITDSMWAPLIESGLPEIFAKLKKDEDARNQNTSAAASTSVAPASGSVAACSAAASTASPTEKKASELYDDAEAACALKNRSAEAYSYKKQSPSQLSETPSKLTESSGLFDPETDDVLADSSLAADFDSQMEFDSETNGTAESDSIESASKSIKAQYPNLIGTMVHKLMERMVTARISSKKLLTDPELDQFVGEIIHEFSSPAIESDKDQFQELLFSTAQTMINGGYPQNNGLPQDLFIELLSADEVYCELPFCYLERDVITGNKTIWSGRMDVVYRSGDAWHIVDYKTDADGENLDVKYQNQLNAYIEAFKETVLENKKVSGDVKETHTGVNIDARTYHIIL